MEQKSMTALVSAFARGYHSENNDTKIFDDFLAAKILTEQEKQQLSFNMEKGIKFFNPTFEGTNEEALRWIIDNYLSPTTLGRSAWAEKELCKAVNSKARQYLIIAAGYDTFAYRQLSWAKEISIFELDHPLMSEDKQKRIKKTFNETPDNLNFIHIDFTSDSLYEKLNLCSAYDKNKVSFCSLLGISYYLSKNDFVTLLQSISSSVETGSTIVFDYYDEYTNTDTAGERLKKQIMLANATKEEIFAGYSPKEINQLLFNCGFSVAENLTPEEITQQFFSEYNVANANHIITAFDNTNYCLAVKK